jgi:hypothetical protein
MDRTTRVSCCGSSGGNGKSHTNPATKLLFVLEATNATVPPPPFRQWYNWTDIRAGGFKN